MPLSTFRNFLLIIVLIGGNAYAQTQLPKCVLFGFGNCIGTLRFSNGDIYTGEFNYGKPNGKGAFTYGNGDSYNGTVAEGQRHGSGTYTSAAGDKYIGQFSEGKFEGVGTYYFLANNRSKGDVYAGEFSSNTFNGQGRYTHSNGQVFVGSFVNGRKSVPIVAPEAVVTKLEPAPASVETAQQLYGSKDSAVKPHQEPASGRSDSNAELKNAVSNLFVTGSLNSTSMTAQLLGWNVDIPSNTTDVPFSLGLGYKLEKNYGLELGYKYHGNQTIFNDAIKFKANSIFAGAYVLLPTYSKLDFVIRGGVGVTSGVLDVSSTTSVSYSGTAANKYYGVGAKYEIGENDKVFIGLTRFKGLIPVSTLSFDLTLDVVDIGLEHSF